MTVSSLTTRQNIHLLSLATTTVFYKNTVKTAKGKNVLKKQTKGEETIFHHPGIMCIFKFRLRKE